MNKSTKITIRVTREFCARLKKTAHSLEMSQSKFITLALEIQIAKALQEAKP